MDAMHNFIYRNIALNGAAAAVMLTVFFLALRYYLLQKGAAYSLTALFACILSGTKALSSAAAAGICIFYLYAGVEMRALIDSLSNVKIVFGAAIELELAILFIILWGKLDSGNKRDPVNSHQMQ